MLAGLAPAGMAASFAARSNSEELSATYVFCSSLERGHRPMQSALRIWAKELTHAVQQDKVVIGSLHRRGRRIRCGGVLALSERPSR